MNFFLLLNTKGDILKNVGKQTVVRYFFTNILQNNVLSPSYVKSPLALFTIKIVSKQLCSDNRKHNIVPHNKDISTGTT